MSLLSWLPTWGLSILPAVPLILPIIYSDLSVPQEAGRFHRAECRDRTQQLLDSELIHLNDSSIFSSEGEKFQSSRNTSLTLEGCYRICGPNWRVYDDVGPRITTWLIPILVLLGNIELSPIDKSRFLAIIHALGDPVDSQWSMMHKLQSWDKLYDIADRTQKACTNRAERRRRAQIVATVFAGFEEVAGVMAKDEAFFTGIWHDHGADKDFTPWQNTARELADSRTNQFLSTCVAIFLYVFQIICAFVTVIGGEPSSPPGGRIGSAMLLSYLISLALMSNTLGGFTSRRTCVDIVARFARKFNLPLQLNHRQSEFRWNPARKSYSPMIEPSHSPAIELRDVNATEDSNTTVTGLSDGDVSSTRPGHEPPNVHTPPIDASDMSSENYFETIRWSGAIYAYRPWKVHRRGQDPRTWDRILKNAGMAIAAIVPITIGFLGSFGIFWNAIPQGYSCRHLMAIAIYLMWLSSALISYLGYFLMTGKYHLRLVIIKDILVGGGVLGLVILSAIGFWNRCSCWSAEAWLKELAWVALEADEHYRQNGTHIYPMIASLCIGSQGLYFASILFNWRKGLRVLRWGESRRAFEWIVSSGRGSGKIEL
jgi:hypothetical protein